ncbi:hypothetical protein JV213_06350, partial [Plesiomonas shigelloides]|uniref:hypothetical protein n=1 Tax=Plesiomonas shigelloides TaxID=703 RepID=UPI001C05579C
QLQQTMLCQNYPLQQNQLTRKKTGLHSPTPPKLQRAHSPTMVKNGNNAEIQLTPNVHRQLGRTELITLLERIRY